MFQFDTIVSIGINEGESISATNRESKENDYSEKSAHNFTRNELLSSSFTVRPTPLNEMAKNAMNGDVKQQLIASSTDNDYQSMKRAFDTFNEKMDLYMNFYSSEMSFLTSKLNNMKDKLNTLDILHHEIDQVMNRQNTAEQKLQVIQEAIFGSQSINNKLDRLELSMQRMHVRIDELAEKQKKFNPQNEQTKQKKQADDPPADSDEQFKNCESKIEQLVGFVHSFAELNRLESTDILNRLGNMQSQLIQFFDVKELIPSNQRNVNTTTEQYAKTVDAKPQHSVRLNETSTIKDAIETNSTNFASAPMESIEMQSTPFTQNEDMKLSIAERKPQRKRKRTTNMVS